MTNARYKMFCILPLVGAGNSVSVVLPNVSNMDLILDLSGNFNSLIFDFVTRQKNAANPNFFIVKQLAQAKQLKEFHNLICRNPISRYTFKSTNDNFKRMEILQKRIKEIHDLQEKCLSELTGLGNSIITNAFHGND